MKSPLEGSSLLLLFLIFICLVIVLTLFNNSSVFRCEGHSSNFQKLNINSPLKTSSNGHVHRNIVSLENSVPNDKERDDKKIFAKQDSSSPRKHSGTVMAATLRSRSEKEVGKLRNEFGDEKRIISRRSASSSLQIVQDIQMEIDDDLASMDIYGNPENEVKNVIPSNRRTRCESDDASVRTTKSEAKVEKEDICAICMDEIIHPKKLKCGHVFCEYCLEEYKKRCNPKCPTCGTIYGKMRGNQPPGTLQVVERESSLSGYEGFGTLVITFDIPAGVQNVIFYCCSHAIINLILNSR